MAHILVIEDNPTNLDLMIYLIEAFGHTALSAADGEAGIAAALSNAYDLIVCDVQLPKLDGYAIARRLKADPELRATPLIAVTALAMVGDRDQLLGAGFDGYISKPIVPETFVAQIEGFLPTTQRHLQAPAGAAGDADSFAAPLPQANATILVVDDNMTNREFMCSLLEPFGYTVLTASSVPEALRQASVRPPDLIVSDLHMPIQDGFELIRALKADPQLRDITVMIHSVTIQSDQDRREAIRLGANTVISRPLEPALLLAEIAACLQVRPES